MDISLQEETQEWHGCEVADEPVVVSKAKPVKASNGVEDKTKPIFANWYKEAIDCQKHGEL